MGWLIGIFIITIILLLLFGLSMGRRLRAVRKVMSMSEETKISEFNKGLHPYGFEYNACHDIVQSGMHNWQREVGYCRLYDDLSYRLKMIFDCEPIYFTYNEKRWLLELWKGQYGITTGGEIGLYNTDQSDIDIPGIFKGPFFECVTDEERIPMAFVLERKGKELFRRKQLHWWLTGFSVGLFSKPKDLVMKVQLTFPNYEMRDAFLRGLSRAGYNLEEVLIHETTIYFVYDKPKTRQPVHSRLRIWFIQKQNKLSCRLYNFETINFKKTLNKVMFLKFMYPILFRILCGQFVTAKTKKLFIGLHNKLHK